MKEPYGKGLGGTPTSFGGRKEPATFYLRPRSVSWLRRTGFRSVWPQETRWTSLTNRVANTLAPMQVIFRGDRRSRCVSL